MSRTDRPTIALAIGDPAGIGAELAAKVLADAPTRDRARLVVFGDRRVLARGALEAGVTLDIVVIGPGEPLPNDPDRPVLVDRGDCDAALIRLGEVQDAAGRSALGNFAAALAFAKAGHADAVTFTPFNKAANRLSIPTYEDEVEFSKAHLGVQDRVSEFNVLPAIWNARVTSHIPLSAVAAALTVPRIVESLRMTDRSMRAAGFDPPRIAVAALNPHAGDGGAFGREDMDVIAPAVEQARAEGIVCEGPFPSDTVFVRARRGDYDGVQTMFHDQGQIAMKLIGFEEGVTLLGGLPVPVTTPAHGTAFDIAGKGIAHSGATLAAVKLAATMATGRRRSA
jgi:4-hydroxythreonine-4-phosphate dehydrogenase